MTRQNTFLHALSCCCLVHINPLKSGKCEPILLASSLPVNMGKLFGIPCMASSWKLCFSYEKYEDCLSNTKAISYYIPVADAALAKRGGALK